MTTPHPFLESMREETQKRVVDAGVRGLALRMVTDSLEDFFTEKFTAFEKQIREEERAKVVKEVREAVEAKKPIMVTMGDFDADEGYSSAIYDILSLPILKIKQ